jgi:hypothetical protein
MADNGLSNGDLSPPVNQLDQQRRSFLKRAALIGLPVALATVRPRTVWAQANNTPSCRASMGTSGCNTRPPMVTGS